MLGRSSNASCNNGRLGCRRCSNASGRGRGLRLFAPLFRSARSTTQKGKPTFVSLRARTRLKGKPAPYPVAIADPRNTDNSTEKGRLFLLSAFSASSAVGLAVSLRHSQISGILPPWPIWPIRPHLGLRMPRGSRDTIASWWTSRSKTKRSSILAQRPHPFFETATNG